MWTFPDSYASFSIDFLMPHYHNDKLEIQQAARLKKQLLLSDQLEDQADPGIYHKTIP
jgi:hypothetical protein